MGRAWFAASLLTVALFVVAVDSASAADEGDAPMVVSADQSGALGVVSTAQSDAEADLEDGTDRRLVGRESSERVDAIVIALWSIAAGMTVMLGIFLWHTSPRRRLRLARRRSTELYEAEGEESERPAEDESVEDESALEPESEPRSDEEPESEPRSDEEPESEPRSDEEPESEPRSDEEPEPVSESVEDAAAGEQPEAGAEPVEEATEPAEDEQGKRSV